MSGCECKTGFFALRDCPDPVFQRCTSCRRAMCRRHSAPNTASVMCLDCVARNEQDDDDYSNNQRNTHRRGGDSDADHHSDNAALDDRWVYAYRHRFYSSGYVPIYAGTHHSTYYDRYDTRSFDNLEVERDDFDDDTGAGFGDS